jgi:hypothetical protein
VRNPAALFISPERRMSTVKIGAGCLVWVGSVEKLSKHWKPAEKPKPRSLPIGGCGEWLYWAFNSLSVVGASPLKASGFLLGRVLQLAVGLSKSMGSRESADKLRLGRSLGALEASSGRTARLR